MSRSLCLSIVICPLVCGICGCADRSIAPAASSFVEISGIVRSCDDPVTGPDAVPVNDAGVHAPFTGDAHARTGDGPPARP